MPRRIAAACLALLVTGCSRDLQLAADPGEAPLELAIDSIEPAVTRAGGDVEVIASGSEVLDACNAEAAGRSASCGLPAGTRCSCRFRLGAELGEGRLEVTVRGAAGTRSAESRTTVMLDLTPPRVDPDRVRLIRRPLGAADRFAAEEGAVSDGGAAYEGQGVSGVRVWADELAQAPLLEAGVGAAGSIAEIDLPGTEESSPAQVWISAVDVPGNESLRIPVLLGRDQEPPAVTGSLLTATLREAGSDGLTAAAGAVIDATGAVREVRLFTSGEGGDPAATLVPALDGSFALDLGDTEASALWIEAEDKSGNTSPRVRAGREMLALELAGRVPGDDTSAPAALYTFSSATPLFAAPGLGVVLAGEATAGDTAAAAGADGAAAATVAAAAGTLLGSTVQRLAPTPRERAPFFHQKGLGLVVERGSAAGSPAYDAWRFDGDRFTYLNDVSAYVDPAGPPALVVPDSKVFRFGDVFHSYDDRHDIVWSRGNEYWNAIHFGVAGPYYAMDDHEFAYDPVRRRTLFVGHYYSNQGGVILDNAQYLFGGSSWTRIFPTQDPGYRNGFGMAWHGRLGGIVLFGGQDLGRSWPSDTWLWNGSNWFKTLTSGPSGRARAAMAYDEDRSTLVLHGGVAPDGTILDDTWELGTEWKRIDVTGPGPRFDAHMAFDPASHRVILHGGSYPSAESTVPSTGALGDTWSFDGQSWTRLIETPAVQCGQSVTWDARRARLVLFGGSHGKCTSDAGYKPAMSSSTWEHDGERWIDRRLETAPPARVQAAMAYDAWRGVVVLFGGDASFENDCGNGTRDCDDTWEYDGTTWRQIPVQGPPPRVGAAMTFDAMRGLVLLHGGATRETAERRGDLWAYDGKSWRRLNVPALPGVRSHHVLAYDAIRDRTITYGSAKSGAFEWDGATWTPGAGGEVPPPVDCTDGLGCWAGAFDPVGGEVILAVASAAPAYSYSYGPAGFKRRANTPLRARAGSAAYDPIRRRLVLHGAREGQAAATWAIAADAPRTRTAAHLVRFQVDPSVTLAGLTPRYTGTGSGDGPGGPPLLHVWNHASAAWTPAGTGAAPEAPAGDPGAYVRDGVIWLLATAPHPSSADPRGTASELHTDQIAMDVVVVR